MVPIGAQLARVYSRDEFAVVFALIWGSYIVTDALAEIGGSLFGKQRIRVWGIGDVNRKSIGGTVSGFAGALAFCLWMVSATACRRRGSAWRSCIAVSNTLLELFSPRGTDDFTMATANALHLLGVRRAGAAECRGSAAPGFAVRRTGPGDRQLSRATGSEAGSRGLGPRARRRRRTRRPPEQRTSGPSGLADRRRM